MERYWEKTYDDICDGIKFRFKKLNPIEHLALVSANTTQDDDKGALSNQSQEFLRKCLQCIEWSVDNGSWRTVVDELDNPTNDIFIEQPMILFDLVILFRQNVLVPVFIESKTFQNVLKDSNKTI